jgi:hypothetical protein
MPWDVTDYLKTEEERVDYLTAAAELEPMFPDSLLHAHEDVKKARERWGK